MTPSALGARAPGTVSTRVSGWGGGEGAPVRLARPRTVDELRAAVAAARSAGGAGVLARGMGRSYGDAAQLTDGLVVETTRLKGFELDAASGTVTAQAGVTLGELLAALVPRGWVVPVLPGTQHVTVAGAIASDIHGKNHAVAGTFGSHVRSLGLLTADGSLHELRAGSHGENGGLFAATIGGMGLTGVIVWATIVLRPVDGPWLSVATDRAPTLDHVLAALSEPGGGPHRVAWLDLLGPRPGRGVVTRAEHASGGGGGGTGRRGPTVKARATVPTRFPSALLRPGTVRAFNDLRYRRSPRAERDRIEGLGAHMFPLDVLDAWPRLYGPRGFVQYQLVVPPGAERVLERTIDVLRRAAVPCYLAVLKDFGPANEMPLSFPIEGWTLALDLPRSAPGLNAALTTLDALVAEAAGRVYLSKDSRLRPEAVRAMYPRLEEWRAVRDRADPGRVWRSDLAIRTGLIESGAP
jgi:decaprenylphospho-beta-D-ribofuranose 2-oxidase